MKRRYRIILGISGVFTIFLGIVFQISSFFTPFIYTHPFLITIISSLGLYIVTFSCLFFFGLLLFTRQLWYLLWACLLLVEFLLIVFTLIGAVFQLGLAGLTLGLSLIVLAFSNKPFSPL